MQAASIDDLCKGTPYRPLKPLGRGGMSEVYLVEHRIIGRQFALKVLHQHFASDPQYVDRARLEAQATARLQHPHIIEILDFWVAPGQRPCLLLELLRGYPLAHELKQRTHLPPKEVIHYGKQILSALALAHGLGIIHRDIKPENLYLHFVRSQTAILKVLDFGLARVISTNSLESISPLSIPTETGTIVGSPRYASPEALRGEHIDYRADLFSLGAVLFQAIAGQGPFDRGRGQLIPPSRYTDLFIPHQLDEVILQALDPNPNRRPSSALEFLSILDQIVSTPI